jgi:hypothetical protein
MCGLNPLSKEANESPVEVKLKWSSGWVYYTLSLAGLAAVLLVNNLAINKNGASCAHNTKSDDVKWTKFDKYVSSAPVS